MEFFKHHGAWAPGVRLFRRCHFAAKAIIISAVFLVPMALLGWNYFADKATSIEFSAKERLGVEYARVLMPALQATLDAPDGKAGVRTALAAIEQRLGSDLGTAASHAAVLKAAAEGSSADTADALLDLLGQVSDGSNLTLDPDIDSYYAMDAAMFRLGQMSVLMSRLRERAGPARGTTPEAVLAQRDVGSAIAVFAYHLDNLRGGMAKAQGANAALADAVKAKAVVDAGTALVGATRQVLQGGEGAAAGWLAFDAALAVLQREHPALTTRMLAALDGLLAARVGGMERQRWLVALTVAVSLSLATYLFFSFFFVTRGGLLEVRRHLAAMTAGDLTTHPVPWGRDEAADLMSSLGNMQNALRGIVTQVRAASTNLVSSSSEIAGGAENLHSRTEQAAANLQESAAAMEEVSSVVRSTATGTREAAQLAAANAELATRGGQIVGSVVENMRAIHASSTKIGEIISTIDGIAFQTNILALNAAVESARAGESGRGFAVVAGEVRALSLRTVSAANEIKKLITGSMEQVKQGQSIVEEAGGAIGEIVGSARRINSMLAEISVGVDEQAQGVTQTSRSVQELDTLTQANSALVEQTAAAAISLKGQAGELAQRVAAFKLPAMAEP